LTTTARAVVSHAEGQIPARWGGDAIELPGSRLLLDELERAGVPWTIVTSGTKPLVTGWLDIMNLAHPKNLVVAEDVERGKPDPACYLLGQKRLGLPLDAPMLVLEDAPAGIRAGKKAGFKVVALQTSHTIEQLKDAEPDWIVKDLRSVTLKNFDKGSGKVEIEIRQALEA
jgi:glycerol-1-phosphatase